MHCCARKADFALCAVVVSKNKPNIVDPLPLMLAKRHLVYTTVTLSLLIQEIV